MRNSSLFFFSGIYRFKFEFGCHVTVLGYTGAGHCDAYFHIYRYGSKTMQAEFLCTVFLYYKKIITIPGGV